MIFWSKRDPNEKIVDVLGLKLEKDVTLDEASKAYMNSGKVLYPKTVEYAIRDIFSVVRKERKLSTFTVKDALTIFERLVKEKSEGEAFRARANVTNIIRFHITGDIPAPLPRTASTTNGSDPEVGKVTITRAKFEKIKHLIPLFEFTGRFGWLKGKVQQLIHELEADEAGYLSLPPRSVTPREAKSMLHAITSLLKKGSLPFVVKFNPAESCLIVVRQKDFDGLMVKNGKKGA